MNFIKLSIFYLHLSTEWPLEGFELLTLRSAFLKLFKISTSVTIVVLKALARTFYLLLQKYLDSDDYDDEASDKKNGFRNRKIIEYENRIRQYSTPDKIFRYFATYRLADDKGKTKLLN